MDSPAPGYREAMAWAMSGGSRAVVSSAAASARQRWEKAVIAPPLTVTDRESLSSETSSRSPGSG